MDDTRDPHCWPTKIDSSGRIMIPVEARNLRGWEQGTELVLEEAEDGTLRLVTLDQFIERVQNYFSGKFRPDRSLVDELREERRHDASRESGH
ncbi:MAG: AbrB/MazE/SpoVT family DNA-binding domain-containing protein [Nitrospira sp.]